MVFITSACSLEHHKTRQQNSCVLELVGGGAILSSFIDIRFWMPVPRAIFSMEIFVCNLNWHIWYGKRKYGRAPNIKREKKLNTIKIIQTLNIIFHQSYSIWSVLVYKKTFFIFNVLLLAWNKPSSMFVLNLPEMELGAIHLGGFWFRTIAGINVVFTVIFAAILVSIIRHNAHNCFLALSCDAPESKQKL